MSNISRKIKILTCFVAFLVLALAMTVNSACPPGVSTRGLSDQRVYAEVPGFSRQNTVSGPGGLVPPAQHPFSSMATASGTEIPAATDTGGENLPEPREYTEEEFIACLKKLYKIRYQEEEEYRRLMDELAASSDNIQHFLEDALNHQDKNIAKTAISVLGEIGGETAVEILLDLLTEGRELQVEEVEVTLPGGSTEFYEGINCNQLSRVYELRVRSIEALSKIGGSVVFEALSRIFLERDSFYEDNVEGYYIYAGPSYNDAGENFEQVIMIRKILFPIAEALANIDPVSAAETFSSALKYEEFDDIAYHGLARCRSSSAATSLLAEIIFDDEADQKFKKSITDTIGELWSFKDMKELLVNGLAREDDSAKKLVLDMLMTKCDSLDENSPPTPDLELKTNLYDALENKTLTVAEKSAVALHKLGWIDELRKALDEKKIEYIADHYVFYIMEGEKEAEPLLIKALNLFGTSDMCEVFIDSGNLVLVKAGNKWKDENKYKPGQRYEMFSKKQITWGRLSRGGQ